MDFSVREKRELGLRYGFGWRARRSVFGGIPRFASVLKVFLIRLGVSLSVLPCAASGYSARSWCTAMSLGFRPRGTARDFFAISRACSNDGSEVVGLHS